MQGAWGSISGQGSRSLMTQLKSPHEATKTQHSQRNKNEQINIFFKKGQARGRKYKNMGRDIALAN